MFSLTSCTAGLEMHSDIISRFGAARRMSGGGCSCGNGLEYTIRGIFLSEKGDVHNGQICERSLQKQQQKNLF